MEIVDVLVAVEHPTAVGGVVRVADGDVWYVQAGSRWAAVASAGAVTITVTAVDLDPEGVQLRTVENPVTSLI
jgi:hypothetical protein